MDKPRIANEHLQELVDMAKFAESRHRKSHVDSLILDLADARRRIAGLEKDAERYRAIRAGKWAIRQGQTIVQIDKGNYAYPLGTGGDLDSAVDTAIAAQRQKEGK